MKKCKYTISINLHTQQYLPIKYKPPNTITRPSIVPTNLPIKHLIYSPKELYSQMKPPQYS